MAFQSPSSSTHTHFLPSVASSQSLSELNVPLGQSSSLQETIAVIEPKHKAITRIFTAVFMNFIFLLTDFNGDLLLSYSFSQHKMTLERAPESFFNLSIIHYLHISH